MSSSMASRRGHAHVGRALHPRRCASEVYGTRCTVVSVRGGRWKTTGALGKYTKVHTLIRRRAELPTAVASAGRQFWRQPARQLIGAVTGSSAAGTPLAKAICERLGQGVDDRERRSGFSGECAFSCGPNEHIHIGEHYHR